MLETRTIPTTIVEPPRAATISSVRTTMILSASPAEVWERLMFYEQIDVPPPLYLRLLLPAPIATLGDKSRVGDEARCLYEGGHLIKRVTGIDRERLYVFSVVEQTVVVGGGMRLSGGHYALRALDDGRTEVTVETRYASHKRPRWLWQPIEHAVCHAFHRHILRAMRDSVADAARAS